MLQHLASYGLSWTTFLHINTSNQSEVLNRWWSDELQAVNLHPTDTTFLLLLLLLRKLQTPHWQCRIRTYGPWQPNNQNKECAHTAGFEIQLLSLHWGQVDKQARTSGFSRRTQSSFTCFSYEAQYRFEVYRDYLDRLQFFDRNFTYIAKLNSCF